MDAIVCENVCKRFRVVTIPKHASFKKQLVGLEFLKRRPPNELFVDAVSDVGFSVKRGEAIGIIGRNGSGKTTLLRLLAGIYKPNSGSIKISGEVAPLLSLGVGFHPDMTGRENVKINGLVLGLSPKQIERKYDEIVEFSELAEFIDVPVRTYSSGMYMRLAFSIAVSVDPDVLLLDEVLAVGDEAFAAKCFARMREFKERGKTIVLVSHDSHTIASWCDTALWMERGRAREQGEVGHVIDHYHREMQAASHVAPAPEPEPIAAGVATEG
jgi:lipopolysaccharide transport system ATP-binding protein